NPIAATSLAPFRQPLFASVSCARHCRTAAAWSAIFVLSSVFFPSISTKHGLSAEPIRSTPPRASCRSSAISNSRYLKLVEPRLATRIFMTGRWARVLSQKRLEQPLGRPCNHVAADKLASLLGRLRARFDG